MADEMLVVERPHQTVLEEVAVAAMMHHCSVATQFPCPMASAVAILATTR